MVYVDSMKAPYRRMRMSHMLADSSEELHAMADRIGVDRKWCQNPGTPREHYDVCLAKRQLAIDAGAQVITRRQLGELLRARRTAATPNGGHLLHTET